ncbi:MAG: Kelch repeat-containing protein [Planctomycetota bacterium]|jgi:N-acetylneuraminic acid mutarotase
MMKETTTVRWLTERGALVILALCIFASLWLSETVAIQENSWESLADMSQERFGHACALVDNTFYVFGGYDKDGTASRHVEAFDFDLDEDEKEWRRLRDMPSAVTHVNAVVDGRSVWIAGGYKDGPPGRTIDEVWKYDVDKDTFEAGPSLPGVRAGGGLALVGRSLHYFGGLIDRDNDSNNHWVLDLDATGSAAKWKNAAVMPEERNQFGTVTYQGKIYAIGGQFGHDRRGVDQKRVDIYDPETDSWSAGTALPKPHSHAENSTFLHDGRIIVVGGRSVNRAESVVWELSTDGTWSQLGKLPIPLIGPAARVIDSRLVVAGGSPRGSDSRGSDSQKKVWAQTLSQ